MAETNYGAATPSPSKAEAAFNAYLKYGFVNRNYEAIKKTAEFASFDRWYNIKGFFKNWLNVLGVILFLFLVFVAIIGPFYTQDPTFRDPVNKHVAAFQYDSGGVYHWLGTDLNGSDNLARIVHGLAYSLGLAAMATLIDIFVGVVVGVLQGYFKVIDKYVRWLTRILQTIPFIILALLLALGLGASFWSIVIALTINGWLAMSYYARTEIIGLKNAEYVTASRILGTNPAKIIWSLVPKLLPIIIAQLLFTIAGAILGDAVVALLGLGQPNVASLGNIISGASAQILLYPLELVWPVLTIILFISSVQLIGNGIQQNINRSNRR